MKELPDLDRYRPNVGICLFNRAGEVWLGERLTAPGSREVNPYRWQMPQGGIDKGENVEEAAFRELHEETGVKSARILLTTPGWLAYDFPPRYRRGKKDWLGQRQKWVVMLFEGENDEIDLNVHEPAEFERWRWAALDELEELIVPFKRQVYSELVEAFRPLATTLAKGSL
ncbi:RNA pyrophosphohydrolase [Parvularcula sp. ZS-1/3]|uniref:RNA pyrophosphohydrolase n=1 Tax=Parvularcula mediterranea TaxID=2732508 RepID=A0A7Y3RLC9_9PROT|nr:RNA pyrophosphohydrolase [Parvularcula mediterranea]NNU16135.1 RNA pyrophosphohydrolase [Parvularcula mediterranea]